MARKANNQSEQEPVPEVQALAEVHQRLAEWRRRKSHARVVIEIEYGQVARVELIDRLLVTGS